MLSAGSNIRLFGAARINEARNWVPKRVEDLNKCDRNYQDFTQELGDKYPGFDDTRYMNWLHSIRKSAIYYQLPDIVPDVSYLPANFKTWEILYTQLRQLHLQYACPEHVSNLLELERLGIYSSRRIPQFNEVNSYLSHKTGFKLAPVGGMVNPRTFFYGLAFRVFFSTQYLRHESVPFYSPEPDIVHELMGHVPLFANSDFADFSQAMGRRALGASDGELMEISKAYFYSIEFGVLTNRKVVGAGILGSCKELAHIGLGYGRLRPWSASEIKKMEYTLSEFQPYYFSSRSLEELKDRVMNYLTTII
jgi:phenylalanine-4-hydroxylase